jgi:hypothetical protein
VDFFGGEEEEEEYKSSGLLGKLSNYQLLEVELIFCNSLK